MPDSRKHRSAGPRDRELFAPSRLPDLSRAVEDLSSLLSHGYAMRSSLKLVGDRFGLRDRQRTAVLRSACSRSALATRSRHELGGEGLEGASLAIDGFNLLTTVESALGGGVVLHGRDGCYRDLASLHGTWRRVEETLPALSLVGRFLEARRLAGCTWYFDQPVSNSGRLRAMVEQLSEREAPPWTAQVVRDPDPLLVRDGGVVVTADSVILDHGVRWVSLARMIITELVPDAWVVDLSCGGCGVLDR
jgi:hypothetical protein